MESGESTFCLYDYHGRRIPMGSLFIVKDTRSVRLVKCCQVIVVTTTIRPSSPVFGTLVEFDKKENVDLFYDVQV